MGMSIKTLLLKIEGFIYKHNSWSHEFATKLLKHYNTNFCRVNDVLQSQHVENRIE